VLEDVSHLNGGGRVTIDGIGKEGELNRESWGGVMCPARKGEGRKPFSVKKLRAVPCQDETTPDGSKKKKKRRGHNSRGGKTEAADYQRG